MKIVFVSMDTVRGDRLGCNGYHRPLTPVLDRLASEGALFTRAFATDIPTQPSHTALFTGRYGVSTGVVSHFLASAALSENEPWLPSILLDAGFKTGAVDHLFSMKGWFERGYQDYMPPPGRSRAPGSMINDLAWPWIRDHAEEDFFLFLHYWDAHIPYVPPAGHRKYSEGTKRELDPLLTQRLRSRPTYPLFKHNLYEHLGFVPNLDYIADLYDDEVSYLDFEIGRLVDYFSELEIIDDTLFVFFGDHGENMVEHDAWFDHAGLYDSVVHVPLIIWRPGMVPVTRIDDMVALVDVMPTVLELLGLEVPATVDGQSLCPLLQGDATATGHEEIVCCEATWQAKRAIRTDRWKLIRCYDPGVFLRSEVELYDLADDPDEQHNVADEHPEVVRDLQARLDLWLTGQLGTRADPVDVTIAEGLPAVARLDRVIEGQEMGNRPGALSTSGNSADANTSNLAAFHTSVDEMRGDAFVLVGAAADESGDAVAPTAAVAGAPVVVGVSGGAQLPAAGLPLVAEDATLAPFDDTAQVPVVDNGHTNGNGNGNGNGSGNGSGSGNVLVESPPVTGSDDGPPDAGQRFSPYRGNRPQNGRIRGPRLFLVGLALLAALALLAYMLSIVLFSNSLSVPGVTTSSDVAELNMSNSGVVTAMNAHLGEVVPAGTVLATQSDSTQEAQLGADQARLASDQAALQELEQPATSAELVNARAQVATATVDLQSAQSKLAETTSAEQASVAAAQSKVQQEQTLENADTQQYQAMIPGCTSADPPGDCGNAEHQVQEDQQAVATAQDAYQVAVATQSSQVGEAQTEVNQASAALAAANAAVTAATIPPTPDQIEGATAKVQLDQSAVARDRLAVDQTELRAPFTGVIAAVGGTVGDVATSNGVRQSSGPGAVGTQGSTGVNLVSPSNPGTATGSQPQLTSLFTLNSLSTIVVAQVGEGDISKVSPGESAHVSVSNVSGDNSFTATVTSISPIPTIVNGQPYYLVKLRPGKGASAVLDRLPHSSGTAAHAGSRSGSISDVTVNVSF